jgi:hypothetical protein
VKPVGNSPVGLPCSFVTQTILHNLLGLLDTVRGSTVTDSHDNYLREMCDNELSPRDQSLARHGRSLGIDFSCVCCYFTIAFVQIKLACGRPDFAKEVDAIIAAARPGLNVSTHDSRSRDSNGNFSRIELTALNAAPGASVEHEQGAYGSAAVGHHTSKILLPTDSDITSTSSKDTHVWQQLQKQQLRQEKLPMHTLEVGDSTSSPR